MAKKRGDPIRTAEQELQREMAQENERLKEAYERFNRVCDPDLVEACIFEINAATARYNYLLRQAKALRGMPVKAPYAVPAEPSAAVPCVAAANWKGGDICHL